MSTATAVATFDPFAVTVPTPGQAVELLAAGDYVGALIGLIDIGTSDNEYKGEIKKQRQFYLLFQIQESKSDGSDHIVGVLYNASLHDKASLRLMIEKTQRIKLEAGQPYDFRSLLGKSFNVLIDNTKSGDRTYHKVAKDGIGPLHRKDDPVPDDVQRDHFIFSVATQDFASTRDLQWGWVPYLYGRPVLEVMKECDEWKGSNPSAAPKDKAKQDVDISYIEGIAAKIVELPEGHPSRDQAIIEMERVQKDSQIPYASLGKISKQLLDDIPF